MPTQGSHLRLIAKLLTYSSSLPITVKHFNVDAGGARPASYIMRAASVAKKTCLATESVSTSHAQCVGMCQLNLTPPAILHFSQTALGAQSSKF
jgi:hypothetical protein